MSPRERTDHTTTGWFDPPRYHKGIHSAIVTWMEWIPCFGT